MENHDVNLEEADAHSLGNYLGPSRGNHCTLEELNSFITSWKL